MRKVYKVFVMFVVSMLFINNIQIVKANEQTYNSNNSAQLIEQELNKRDSSILMELNNALHRLELELKNTEDEKDKINIKEQLEVTMMFIDSYNKTTDLGIYSVKANDPNLAVSAVLAWFNNQGYKLSFELLTHAVINTNKTSTYIPSNKAVVANVSAFVTIAKGSSTSGSFTFLNTGGTAAKDCYYALHKVKYTKTSSSSRTVKISDYYDFADGDLNYSGIEGIAVNAMYTAQKNGQIIPFNVSFSATYVPPNYV